jgi:hypothetical protein
MFDLSGMTSPVTPLKARICVRSKTIFSKAFNAIARAESPCKNNFLSFFPKLMSSSAILRPIRGAFRDRHERWARDAVGVSGCSMVDPCGRTTRHDRRNRVVLASRCWRQGLGTRRVQGPTGARKPVPGEITYKPFKPSRREGRISGVPVVLPRAFCCTRTMGAVGTRPSPAPSVSKRAIQRQTSDAHCAARLPRFVYPAPCYKKSGVRQRADVNPIPDCRNRPGSP